tara:strand:- start:4296 stop:4616 length:321 start_codon:yes stop_codon:yes gene_type:complete
MGTRNYYFNLFDGSPLTPNSDAGDEQVVQGRAIKIADVPDDVETWRLSYDTVAEKLVIAYEGDSEADAQIKKEADSTTLAKAEADKEQADMAERKAAAESAGVTYN